MIVKRAFVMAIAVAMLSVSFAVGISVNVQAGTDFMKGMNVPWDITFTPHDMAWNDAGDMGVVVGHNDSAEATHYNMYVYYPANDTWFNVENPWTYNQNVTSVCWDSVNDGFWIGSVYIGLEDSTLMFIGYGTHTLFASPYTTTLSIYSLAADNWGNVLIAEWGFSDLFYMDIHGGIGWANILAGANTSDLGSSYTPGMTFNPNDGCFYIVGEAAGNAVVYYTDSTSIATLVGKKFWQDTTGFFESYQFLNSIDWNVNANYGLAVGSAVVKVNPGGAGGAEIRGANYSYGSLTNYLDVSWDTDGYGEAALVGLFNDGTGPEAHYWRYAAESNAVTEPFWLSTDIPWCVGFKPPASPKFPIIPILLLRQVELYRSLILLT